MRTLILSCSATKRPDVGLLRAVDRYDGPAWRTLRAWRFAAGELQVLALSAEHGLLWAERPIADYDRRMNAARAAVLAPKVGESLLRLDQTGKLAGEVLVFGGEAYRECLRLGLHGTPLLERLRFTAGGIGEQLGQLKSFLLEGYDERREAELAAIDHVAAMEGGR